MTAIRCRKSWRCITPLPTLPPQGGKEQTQFAGK